MTDTDERKRISRSQSEIFVRSLARRVGGQARQCACGNWYVSREQSTCPVCRGFVRVRRPLAPL
jgi:hypothetical protein